MPLPTVLSANAKSPGVFQVLHFEPLAVTGRLSKRGLNAWHRRLNLTYWSFVEDSWGLPRRPRLGLEVFVVEVTYF